MRDKESASVPRAVARPVVAGVVAGVVGFGSSFAVVLAGLQHVGATPAQARSGLLVLCVVMGLASIGLALTSRLPVTIAYSTPGAALLAAAPRQSRFSDAVFGFVVCGVLLALAGVLKPLTDLVRAVPHQVSNALLAGVLLPLAMAPVTAVRERPALALPVAVVWLAVLRTAPRWAAIAALLTAGVVAAVDPEPHGHVPLLPHVSGVLPSPSWHGVLQIGVPLFLVTMAGQNLPGVAVMASFGYRVPLRSALLVTGAGSALSSFGGGHAINLAALSAALSAGPEAGPDLSRRWVASVSNGGTYVLFGLAGGLITAGAALVPPVLLAAVAGIALLGTFRGALQEAFSSAHGGEAAAVTLLVTVSGVTFGGVGAPVLGLAAGLVVWALVRPQAATVSTGVLVDA